MGGYQYFLICEPCADVRHEECVGGVEFCMCFVELMWEAEETDGVGPVLPPR